MIRLLNTILFKIVVNMLVSKFLHLFICYKIENYGILIINKNNFGYFIA